MTAPFSDYNAKLQVLLKGVNGNFEDVIKGAQSGAAAAASAPSSDKIREIISKMLSECIDGISKEEKAIQEAVHKAEIGGVKVGADIEKRFTAVQHSVQTITDIFSSKVGKFVSEGPGNHPQPWDIRSESFQIERELERLEFIGQVLSKDPAFERVWGGLSIPARETILSFFQTAISGSIFRTFSDGVAKSQSGKMKEGILKFLTQHVGLLKDVDDQSMARLFHIYLQNYEHSPAKAEQLMQDCFACIASVDAKIRHSTANCTFRVYSGNENHETYLKAYSYLCKQKSFDPAMIDSNTVHLLPLFIKDPESYKRWTANAYHFQMSFPSLFNHLDKYCEAASIPGCRALLDLVETLPNTCKPLDSLFRFCMSEGRKGAVNAGRLVRLESLILWLNEQVKANSSSQNQGRLCGILDNVVALSIDRPEMADSLLRMPKASFHLLESVFACRKDIQNVTEIEVKEVLRKSGAGELADAIFDNSADLAAQLKALSSTNALEPLMHGFLDAVLNMQFPPITTPPNASIEQKLQKLPHHYSQVVNRMFVFAGDDGKALFEILKFAKAYPFTKTLIALMENLTNFSKKMAEQEKEDVERQDRIVRALKEVNGLAEAFPDSIPQVISLNFNSIQPEVLDNSSFLLLNLLAANKPVLQSLLELHPEFLKEKHLKIILGDADIQAGMLKVMEMEKKSGLPILQIFEMDLSLVTSKTLMKALARDPGLTGGLENCLRTAGFTNWGGYRGMAFWLVIIQAMEARPKEAMKLIKDLGLYPKTLFNQLKLLSQDKPPVITALEQTKHPSDVGRLAFLWEQNEDDLANQILEIFNADPDLAHRLLDMAYAQYIPEVKDLIKMGNEKPGQVLTQRLLELAGSTHAPMLASLLRLDPATDQAILKMAEKPGKEVLPLLSQLLILKAQGEGVLLNSILEILAKPLEKREPFERIALQAVEEGRFLLAGEFLRNKGKPYLLFYNAMGIPPLASLQKWGELARDWEALDKKDHKLEYSLSVKNGLLPFVAQLAGETRKNPKIFEEWIGKVQFMMQHRPHKLFEILAHPDWRDFSGNLWEISQDVIEVADSFLPPGYGGPFDAAAQTSVSVALANCLITPSGCINTGLINHLKLYAYLKSAGGSQAGDYFERVLTTLLGYPDFNERLAKCGLVPHRSRQETVIAQLLKLPPNQPISGRQAKVAIVSALLWPLRQGVTGSCFATSSVIQNANRVEGLKLLLEDCMAIVTNGCVQRRSKGVNNGSVEYPLVMGKSAALKLFAGDNLLSRTLEYTLASMGPTSAIGLKSHACQRWSYLLQVPYYKDSDYDFNSLMKKTLLEQLEKGCTQEFNGYATHPSAKHVGAWLLLENQTGDPLEEDGVLLRFFSNVFQSCKETLSKQHAAKAQIIARLFDVDLPATVRSFEFNRDFFSSYSESYGTEGLALVDPLKYAKMRTTTPLAMYGIGGYTVDVMSSMYGVNVVKRTALPSDNPFEGIAATTQLLTDDEQRQALSNPNYMRPVESLNHAFNFKAGQAMSLLQKKSPAELWEEHKKKIADVESIQLPKAEINTVAKAFLICHPGETQSQLWLEMKDKLNNCITVRQLCDLLYASYKKVYGQVDGVGRSADAVENALRGTCRLANLFPPIYPLYDSNWITKGAFGYGIRIFDRTLQKVFPASFKQIDSVDWSPEVPHKLSCYQYRDTNNPYFRPYFKPR